MKIAIKLSKIYFKQTISQFFQTKKLKNKLFNTLFVVTLFLIVSISMGFSYWGTAEQFSAVGKSQYVLIIGLMFASFLVLCMTAYDAQNQYYKNKDYDMLASMPIKTTSIITAKYLSSYLISQLYCITMSLPAIIVYFVFCPINFVSILFAIISLIFIPTFTQLIGSLFAFLLSFATCKLKNKNLVNNILTVIFTIALIVFISLSNSGLMDSLFAKGIPLWIKIIFPHVYFLFNAVTTTSFLPFVIFLLLTIIYAIISILLVSLGYKKVNANQFSNKKTNNSLLKYKKSKVLQSLIKKESKTFFFTPAYFINCLIGPLIVIVLSIAMAITTNQTYDVSQSVPPNFYIVMYICFSSICMGIANPTSSSISIEGNKFYSLKSLPISAKQIITSKMLFSILLFMPFLLIGNTIFVILVPCSFELILMIFITPLISLIVFTGIGMFCNLRWPKLNWVNETQAIKMGLGLLVSMLITMIITMIPFLIYLFLFPQINSIFNLAQYFSLYIILLVIIGIFVYHIMYKKAEKMLKNIN